MQLSRGLQQALLGVRAAAEGSLCSVAEIGLNHDGAALARPVGVPGLAPTRHRR
jgi:hypothetical protein